jgi:hypothetical protein
MDRFPSTWVLLQFYYTYVSGPGRELFCKQDRLVHAQRDAGGISGLTKTRLGRCGIGETPKAFPIL